MATPPKQDPNDPYPFGENEQPPNVYIGTPEEQRKWNQKRRAQEDDESLAESVLEAVDDGFGCSRTVLGCAWQIITLVPRLVWKVISEIFD